MNEQQIAAMRMGLEALKANQPINYCMNNNGEKFPMLTEDPFRHKRNEAAITALTAVLANQALDKMAENAREIGLDYEPKQNPVAWVDAVMEQAQVFASAWSLVGGRFDDGSGMEVAEEAKSELRAMLTRHGIGEKK